MGRVKEELLSEAACYVCDKILTHEEESKELCSKCENQSEEGEPNASTN